MTLTPATIRLDLKCGKGAISKGEKCTKGVATQVEPRNQAKSTTRGLEKGTTEQLVAHRNMLQRELEHKYAKPISNMKQYEEYLKWSAKRPEQAEIDAVNKILIARNKARRDAFIGNKKLNCGPGSKPCGNACIPKDHKCRASWNKPVKLAAGAAALTGAAVVGTAFLHPRSKMRQAAREIIEPTLQTGFAAGNVARGNWTGAAKNAANVAATGRGLGRNLSTLAEGYGTDIKNAVNRGRNAAFKWRNHRPAKRRDTVWAEGFAS